MPKENPYERFHGANLILRDELAIDRTILANERTMLAYVRSGIALVLVGLTFVNLWREGMIKDQSSVYVGFGCLPSGLLVACLGYHWYRKMDKSIRAVRRSLLRKAPSGASTEEEGAL